MYAHIPAHILCAAQSGLTLPGHPDRALVLNGARHGEWRAVAHAITAAIEEEHVAYSRGLIHTPDWLREPRLLLGWQNAALASAAAPAGCRQLALFMTEYAELLRVGGVEAAITLQELRTRRQRLIGGVREVEARRNHYHAANGTPAEIRWSILGWQLVELIAILCDAGAIVSVIGTQFGIGVGVPWSLVPVAQRLLAGSLSIGTILLAVVMAHYVAMQAARSRWRQAIGVPLAVLALAVISGTLAAVRYSSSFDLTTLTSGVAQIGTIAVGALGVVVGMVGAAVAGGIGTVVEARRAQLRGVRAAETQFEGELRDLRGDLKECEDAIPEAEHNARLPALASVHFEQSVGTALPLVERFRVDLARRLAQAEAVFAQLAALSVPDREAVGTLLREIVDGAGEGA